MFNLEVFLKESLKRKEFEVYGDNWFFCYDWDNNKLYVDYTYVNEQCDVYFEDIPLSVLKVLRENHVSIDDIKKAYIKLGWY